MRPDEIRRHGASLAERVRREIDTPVRLDLLLRRQRRSRVVVFAAAAVAVMVLVVGTLWLTAVEDSRVADQPPTTTPSTTLEQRSLPVEVYIALLDEFVVESEAMAHCTGTGIHAGIRMGSEVSVVDDRPDQGLRVVAEAVIADTGALIDATRVDQFGLPGGQSACLFEVTTITAAIEEVGSLRIGDESWPPPGGFEAGASRAGQQFVFYSRGESP